MGVGRGIHHPMVMPPFQQQHTQSAVHGTNQRSFYYQDKQHIKLECDKRSALCLTVIITTSARTSRWGSVHATCTTEARHRSNCAPGCDRDFMVEEWDCCWRDVIEEVCVISFVSALLPSGLNSSIIGTCCNSETI